MLNVLNAVESSSLITKLNVTRCVICEVINYLITDSQIEITKDMLSQYSTHVSWSKFNNALDKNDDLIFKTRGQKSNRHALDILFELSDSPNALFEITHFELSVPKLPYVNEYTFNRYICHNNIPKYGIVWLFKNKPTTNELIENYDYGKNINNLNKIHLDNIILRCKKNKNISNENNPIIFNVLKTDNNNKNNNNSNNINNDINGNGNNWKRPRKPASCPKRPLSAYFLFSIDRRNDLRQSNPAMRITQLSKIISLEWRNLQNEEKQVYEEVAKEERERYNKEFESYKLSGDYKKHMLSLQQYEKKKMESCFQSNTINVETRCNDINNENKYQYRINDFVFNGDHDQVAVGRYMLLKLICEINDDDEDNQDGDHDMMSDSDYDDDDARANSNCNSEINIEKEALSYAYGVAVHYIGFKAIQWK